MLLKDPEHAAHSSVEGLAYASLQPTVKEELSRDSEFLKKLVQTLEGAPPKSPLTYGALSIFLNLTVFQPKQTEEEQKMQQLKAYANAAGKIQPVPLNDDEHVTERCKRVFEAGLTPVLVSHSKNGSVASLSLVISIVYSFTVLTSLRGQLAQQGAVRLLIAAWAALPATEAKARRTAAQALARILISTNPSHVFGGNRPTPQSTAIRPLVSIVGLSADSDSRDLLPTFEALMALTNLASTDDDARAAIVRAVWPTLEDQLLSSNPRITTAAVELVCNLVQSPEAAILYVSDRQAAMRLHVLLALADAEDEPTRSGAGGALAALTGIPEVVKGIVDRERGVDVVLGLCSENSEELRHRGAFIAYNMIAAEGEAGRLAREKIRASKGIEVLTQCAKKSRRSEVVEVTVQALKELLEDKAGK